MDSYLGTFAVDDNIHTAKLSPRTDTGAQWGTGMGTGWTAELEVHKAGVDTVLTTLSGTWETADEFSALFIIGTVALLAPTAPDVSSDYDAFLKLTKLTSVYIAGPDGDARTPFRFTVRNVSP